MHTIYTIKDTVIVRVNQLAKQVHPLEQRYLKMFTNIDLRSNFYFSYSYDLTRTLQYNLSAPRFVGDADIERDEPLPDWGHVSVSEYSFIGSVQQICKWHLFCLENHGFGRAYPVCFSQYVPQEIHLERLSTETDGWCAPS